MTSDYRTTPGTHDVVDALECHGYRPSDDQHAGGAFERTGDTARQDREAVILTGTDVSTVFAALDIAADCKRDRAAACADCACQTCQSRLRDAQANDRLAGQILHAAEASAATAQVSGSDRAQPAPGQPQAAAGPEAGQ